MSLSKVENIIIKVLKHLDVSFLENLENNFIYNECNNEIFIDSFLIEIDFFKSKGIKSLYVKESKCKYCYPDSNAFEFYDDMTNKFKFRYVIHQKNEREFIIQECKNRIIPNGENGIPF